MSPVPDALDLYDEIVKTTIDEYIALKVDWELTYRCNLSCRHCYQLKPRKEPELSTQEACSILDELAKAGCLYITFTGGEIFLRDDFFAIAHYALQKEFAIRLFTNGTLIDDALADKIKELNPLTVEISLYGANPGVHERITEAPGSYERTVRAIHLLRERNVRTVVKCTVMKENAGELDGLRQFSQRVGASFIFSFTIIPKLDNSTDLLRFRLNERQLAQALFAQDWLTEERVEGGVKVYQPLCAAAFNSLYISPYGEVSPCVVLRQHSLSLREKRFSEIWGSEYFQTLRRITLKDLKKCFSCKVSSYCDRCAGLAYLEAGDLYGISPNDCMLARARKDAFSKRKELKSGKEKEEVIQEASHCV